ncbi:Transposase (or an inactivated derivative) [Mesorhizobium muleiense]|uniref:Mutator family transposase n=1 Tax=Mesorhizobium muleiense TaxID=1004279 RepID=A0A1G9L7N7_9HYPH|nr:Transposase (or an inactivated derivative) [Mesorhizobium muleiense]
MAVIQELYVHGISSRSVDDLVKAMGAGGMSKSQVSRLCANIDERVNAFLTRPLEGAWPYLWLEATYLKVREGGRIVSRAVIIAAAVKREVLGVAIRSRDVLDRLPAVSCRSRSAWREAGHRRRDKGLRAAAAGCSTPRTSAATFTGCATRLPMRRRSGAWAVAAMPKSIFAQETKADAETQWEVVADALREKQSELGALMDASRDDVLAYMSFPREHWAQIASTNPLERVNREIKRRGDVIGIFPNDDAIVRLVGALMLETNDQWAVARRYMHFKRSLV